MKFLLSSKKVDQYIRKYFVIPETQFLDEASLNIFLQYFVSFLQCHLSGSGRSLQYIQWCLDNSHRAQAAPRKLPPSSVEIAVNI